MTSVDQNTDTARGYLPEVEQAVADTAPAGLRVSCASDGAMILTSATSSACSDRG